MYLKDFTELVKINLGEHDITKLNWLRCGDENDDNWREVSFEKPDRIYSESGQKIHYEFTRRGYDKIYFEIHCHHPNQKKWDELRKKMEIKGQGIVDSEKYQHPTRPTASESNKEKAGSRVLNHKKGIELKEGNEYVSSDPELIEKVKKMTEIVIKMYDLYDGGIQSNQKDFPMP
jgi:hypothetical protein